MPPGIFVPGHTATDLGKANRFDRVPINDRGRVAREAVKAVLQPRPEWFGKWIMAGATRAVTVELNGRLFSSDPSNA